MSEGPAMAAIAEDRREPFGVTGSGWAALPGRDGARTVNVRLGGGPGSMAGRWLAGAAGVLGLLAAAAAAVSWQAQYRMVWHVKQAAAVSAIEAGIPDAGALVFAGLGIALALHGRRALRPRALNAACIGISLIMNALAAGPGWRDVAIWVMPSAVYALASDTLIGVVRAWVLARQRGTGETLADDGPTPLALIAAGVLWLLRLALAPRSTLSGFRAWVVDDCPVAPGRRPGHLAELEAVRRDAEQQVALAARRCEEVTGRAACQARQARDEAMRARAAEAAMRDELQQVRDDCARLVGEARTAAAARIAAVEEARAEVRAERDRLAAALRAGNRPRGSRRRPGTPQQPRRRHGGPTKRDRMIELAGQRRDLASVPLGEVSRLAGEVAAEIGYSPGTARRELVRHVRRLQAARADVTADGEGGKHDG
jgi:hypothetical protein